MTQLPLFILMIGAGIGIPIMALLNAQLGQLIGSPIAAVAILTFVAFTGSLALLAVLPGAADWGKLSEAPWVWFGAGLFFVIYIGTITYTAPKIGLGNAVMMVLLGQLVCSAVIDHFGLGGAARMPLDMQRAAGLFLLAAGGYLIIAR